MSDHLDNASKLISRHIDGVITPDEQNQLAILMKSDSEVIDLYVHLLTLHGQLTWGASVDLSPEDSFAETKPTRAASAVKSVRLVAGFSVAVLLLALAFASLSNWPDEPDENNVTETVPHHDTENSVIVPSDSSEKPPNSPLPPLNLDGLALHPESTQEYGSGSVASTESEPSREARFAEGFSDQEVAAFIDQQINTMLLDNEVEPSPSASANEFTRRAWLTIAGRIPPVDALPASDSAQGYPSRTDLIARLVSSSERHQRLADVWTRLLIGRSMRAGIDRAALHRFLLDGFAENRSWMTIVRELVSAEGQSDKDGATNFLLAHLDNQATPATAVTARLFLGEQLQCVQCHNHPFATEIHQTEYWAFNAFFQHAERRPVQQMVGSTSDVRPVLLVDRIEPGMTYFETRNGRQQAVLPRFSGRTIPADSTIPRRRALADLLAEDPQQRVARAMVNRVWADFFGVGFTTAVDDMGPHAIVSHPELLEALTEAFVSSDYDLKRLQIWIAASDAWQRSSRATEQNTVDAPFDGTMPLFSRVYARRMAPEQVYDSVHMAVHELSARTPAARLDSEHRQRWVSQFARPYGTDENDESVEFNGGVTQAMALMNGPDLNDAVRQSSTALLQEAHSTAPDDILKQVSLAVLSRLPTRGENEIFRRRLRQLSRMFGFQTAMPQVTEDMTWAYLNSSEFLLIH